MSRGVTQQYYDVVVCGGGTAGAIAAIAAARQGASVLIVETEGFLGGNATTGLPFLGFYGPEGKLIVGGIAEEIVASLVERNASPGHIQVPRWYSFTPFNPAALRLLLLEKAVTSGTSLLLHGRVVGCRRLDDGRVGNVIVETVSAQKSVAGRVFIDATGDGVVARMCGAPVEKDPALQAASLVFTLSGFDRERFTSFLRENPAEIRGLQEGWTPEFYARSEYSAFCGLFSLLREENEAGRLDLPRDFICFSTAARPEEVTIVATRVPHCDGTRAESLSAGEITAQLQVTRVVGFLKRRVPGFEQAQLAFMAHRLGIRESFRLVGDYVVTEEDIISGTRHADTIALGSWPIDIHSGQDSGQVFKRFGKSYGIPYRCLFTSSVENLLVAGRCISVTHVALGSTRTMAQCMAIGHAAGVAAVLSLDNKEDVTNVPVEGLIEQLMGQGAILDLGAENGSSTRLCWGGGHDR